MLTAERLREVLDYDPDIGVFRWRVSCGSRAKRGSIAGYDRIDGYRGLRFDGREYLVHRLVWLFIHGEFPAQEIDHRNGKPGDNRLENLRTATHSENIANSKCRRDNVTGIKGVSKRRDGGFVVEVQKDGKRHYVGYFSTSQQAHAAYARAAREFHGEFARAK